MVSLTCSVQSHRGISLVTARLDGGGASQRVRLTNRLDGPVWPPKRHGVPDGWDGSTVERVVPAEGTVAIGYASPAEPADPPLEISDRERVSEGEEDESMTAATALRRLGDPSPPRDAVPVPSTTESNALFESNTSTELLESKRAAVPDGVVEWLDDVEKRIGAAEQLTEARSLPDSTAALREVGSLDAATELVERVECNESALTTVAERANGLAKRAEATDVPLETLDRLT